MDYLIEKAKKISKVGEWFWKFSIGIWAIVIPGWAIDYVFGLGIPQIIFHILACLFAILFIGGGGFAQFYKKRAGYLENKRDEKLEYPSEVEVYGIYFKRIVTLVYVLGTICVGLLIYIAFPISNYITDADKFLREYLPSFLVTALAMVVYFGVILIWAKIGERYIEVSEEDVYNRRHETLVDRLSSILK